MDPWFHLKLRMEGRRLGLSGHSQVVTSGFRRSYLKNKPPALKTELGEVVKPLLRPTTCEKGKVPLRAHSPLVQGSCQNLFHFHGVKMSQASDSDPSCSVGTQGKVAAMVAFNTPAETQLGPPLSNGKASIGQVASYPIPWQGSL